MAETETKWIPILRTGKFKDSKGTEHEFTQQDLDDLVAKYNPSHHEAPEVIGHPKTNGPAWGWVAALRREGDMLFYQARDRVTEFQDMLNKKMFKKRSVRINPELGLVHVGYLGAMAPAVKGLPDVALSDGADTVEFEFSEADALNSVGRILQRLREWMIEKFGQDTADRVVGNWEIDDLKQPNPEAAGEAAFSASATPGTKEEDTLSKDLEDKLKTKEKEAADFSEANKTLTTENAELKSKLAQIGADKRRSDFASFCEGLSKEGKLTPAMQPAAMDFMEILSGAEEYEFAEGDGKVKAQPVDRFKSFLSGLPKQMEFSEKATKGAAAETGGGEAQREKAISDYQAANEGCDYKTATLAVSKEHPELFTER